MPGKGARRGADMRRAAAALLLVAAAALGLRAGGAFSAAGSPEILGLSGQAVYWVLAAAELILVLAGIVLLILRMIWARKSGKPLQRRRRSVWLLLLLPLVVFGLSKILRRVAPRAGRCRGRACGERQGRGCRASAGREPVAAVCAVRRGGPRCGRADRLPPPPPGFPPAARA